MVVKAFAEGNLIVEPALRREIVGRVMAAGLPDRPAGLAHDLGRLDLPDGRRCGLFVRHAVDAVLTDCLGHIVLITRRYTPGAGLLAIPGGFLDEVGGRAEGAEEAARRELAEETGIAAWVIGAARLLGVGWRRYDRPFDLRVAWGDLPDAGILKGDVFMVSTQPVYLRTAADLSGVRLAPADDATGACVRAIGSLTAETLGIPDQLGMILEMPGGEG